MKLLFVAKREPQQRDLVRHPYGRFHWLPAELARRGHEVQMLLVSHQGTAATDLERDGVSVSTFDPRHDGLLRTMTALTTRTRSWRPDWVVGCSDAWYGWLAHRLAHRTGAALAIDAYDNYEAYMPWNLPLHLAWRRALRAADVVTAAGPQLATLLQRSRTAAQRTVAVVPMAADPAFVPHDRIAARMAVGLPTDAPLVGYFGGWTATRGTDILLEAFAMLCRHVPDARLVLSGRPPAHALARNRVHPLGYIDDALLPLALSAMDVACVITADTAFGRYSYPAKLYEAMACGVPVVATGTPPIRWILRDDERFLAPVGDAGAIAERITLNLPRGHADYPSANGWDVRAAQFESLLRANA